eukprot:478686-Pleurochrysis_carterae.AAC.1
MCACACACVRVRVRACTRRCACACACLPPPPSTCARGSARACESSFPRAERGGAKRPKGQQEEAHLPARRAASCAWRLVRGSLLQKDAVGVGVAPLEHVDDAHVLLQQPGGAGKGHSLE